MEKKEKIGSHSMDDEIHWWKWYERNVNEEWSEILMGAKEKRTRCSSN